MGVVTNNKLQFENNTQGNKVALSYTYVWTLKSVTEHLSETQTHNFLLLTEEGMAFQSFTELTLWDVGKDFILSFISRAVGDSTKKSNRGRKENTY